MTILKFAMTVTARGLTSGVSSVARLQTPKLLLAPTSAAFSADRWSSSSSPGPKYRVNHLTKAMALTSSVGHKLSLENSTKPAESGKAASLKLSPCPEQTQPLVVMLPWLMSKPQHVQKYAKLYLKLGFDVLTVRITPWQLLWPTKGSQLVARDLLHFLEVNGTLQPLLVHGFSVGGYLWGEMLSYAERDRERYSHVISRIVGHLWDSAADMQDIEAGLPFAVFPNNQVLQNALRHYVKYHMRTFYEAATQHYIRSSQMFHSSGNMVRSPGLLMFSKKDPIGTPDSNMRVRDNWDALGIKTYVKCFEKSPHVGHFQQYPDDYVAEVAAFLGNIGLMPVACKAQAKAKL